MIAVFRYDLAETDDQTITMPKGAMILEIARQTRFPLLLSMWALVDDEMPLVERRIVLRGTGHEVPIDEGLMWISTYQETSGYVWHFFDGGES